MTSGRASGFLNKPKVVSAETAAEEASEQVAAATAEARDMAAELKTLRKELDSANRALAKVPPPPIPC
jgi:chromosome segregation ATPase